MHDAPQEINETNYTRYFKKYRIDIVEYQNGTKKFFPYYCKMSESFSNGKNVGKSSSDACLINDRLTTNKGLDTYQESLEYINKDKAEDILNNIKVKRTSIEIE